MGNVKTAIDFTIILTDLAITLKQARRDVAAVILNYGNFIQTAVDFVVIAVAIFLVVKGMNSLKKKEETAPAEPPAPSKEEMLLAEIRDLLKQK